MKFEKTTYYKSDVGEVFCYFEGQEIDDSVLRAMSLLEENKVDDALREYSKKQQIKEAKEMGIEKYKELVLEQVKARFSSALSSNTKSVDVKNIGQVNASRDSLKDFQDLLRDNLERYQIRMFDNSFKTVSKTELEAIEKAIRSAGQELYAKKWQYENQVTNAYSVEELLEMSFEF